MKRKVLMIFAGVTTALLLLPTASCAGGKERAGVTSAPADTETNVAAAAPESVRILRAFANLTFKQPVFLTWLPTGDDQVAVLEQAGKILAFDNRDNVRQAATWLDISNRVKLSDDEGLLGLVFDPAFGQNGYFYVFYSAAAPRRAVVSRFSMMSGDPGQADPNSEKTILQIPLPADRSDHIGGGLAFGADGMLYISVGDGGGNGDPDGNAQNLGSLLGKILRIDPASGDPYSVPADNPFTGLAGARGEVWAYGFSNPYRFSFDPARGDLWAGDNGRDRREEIDLVTRGGNYGWDIYEGNQERENPDNQPPEQFVPPVIEYGRERGRSIIGGYVYHGLLAHTLNGTYIYGDYYSGRVWSLIYRDGEVALNDEIGIVPGLSSFGQDKNGELYAMSISNNQIYRFHEIP